MSAIRLFLALLSLLLVWPAHAEPFAAIGTSLSFEQNPDGRSIEVRQPFAIRGGYRLPLIDLYGEYQTFSASEGSDMIHVARQHHEWTAWVGHSFLPRFVAQPYVSIGTGIQYDIVDTAFDTEGSRDTGVAHPLLAAATGVRARVWKSLDLLTEGRIAASDNFAPNPLFAVVFLVGWGF